MKRWSCIAAAAATVFVSRGVEAGDEDIRLSGIGYLPDRTKVASITAEAEEFAVVDVETGESVLEGALSDPLSDEETKVVVRLADFTEVREPGIYRVEVPGVGTSHPFPISEDVYYEALRTAMLGFYGWRSGIDISLTHGGETFSHEAGHLEDGYLDFLGQEGVFKDGVGGWYDAGDYGKYMVNGAFAVGLVMTAYEDFKEFLDTIELQIPERGGDVPDFLDEIRYQIEWVLKMQLEDGSVSHKLSTTRFGGFVLPAEETEPRYFAPPSTAAAAGFVAVVSKASRIFQPYDEEFASRCLGAAALSYEYLKLNPENMGADLTGFQTGTYQTDDADDRMWAAAEYYETTGDPDALEDFETQAAEWGGSLVTDIYDWQDVGNLGVFTYLRSAREERDPALVARIEEDTIEAAAEVAAAAERSPFGRGVFGFWWGSNGTVARTCTVLHAAYGIDNDTTHLDNCAEQIGYLYGRNLYGRSQVTGEGLFPPCKPHDRRSGGDDVLRPYPGLLVGGGSEPRNWVDESASYETNEVAINWNGALVYALASLASGDGGESAVGFEPEFDDCTVEAPPPPEPPEKGLDGEPVIIDDFEDGDDWILENDGRRGQWFVEDDGTGENDGFVVLDTGYGDSKRASYIYASGYTGWGGGIGCNINDKGEGAMPYDASDYGGISFMARGTGGRTFTLSVIDRYSTYDLDFDVSNDWLRYVFAWEEFGAVSPSEIKAIKIRWGRNAAYEMYLDDIAFATPDGYVNSEDQSEDADAGEDASAEDSASSVAADGACGCTAAGRRRYGFFDLMALIARGETIE